MQKTQLYIEIRDADYTSEDEFVNSFSIDIDQIPVGIETSPQLYNGSFRYSSIKLSFKVECFITHYFPYCDRSCEKTGNCSCFPGYEGGSCEVNTDDCLNASCRGNSVCVDEINSYRCECIPGFNGEDCSLRGEDDCIGVNCSGNGQCIDDLNSYQCVCEPEYTGILCEILISGEGKNTVEPWTLQTSYM